jgi:peptide-methionine (S)-S-oxide reductase
MLNKPSPAVTVKGRKKPRFFLALYPGGSAQALAKPKGLNMRNKIMWLAVSACIVVVCAVLWANGKIAVPAWIGGKDQPTSQATPVKPLPAGMERVTFGAGCFWCTAAVFAQLKGVESVVSGYSGGFVQNPTYKQVCAGTTGHAEVIQVTYDPKVISFVDLLEVFWKTHDPTTPNRQGHDIGTQYRSVIFYHTEEQKELAEEYKEKLDISGAFDAPIVTQIAPLTEFYVAETKHQNFFADNPGHAYCRVVIAPKFEKFQKVFKDKLKSASPR